MNLLGEGCRQVVKAFGGAAQSERSPLARSRLVGNCCVSNLGLQYFPVVVLESRLMQRIRTVFCGLKISMFLRFVCLRSMLLWASCVGLQLQDVGALRRLMKISNLVGFSTSAPLFFLVFFYGDYFLDIFGEGYAEAFSILQVLALGNN